MTAPVATDRLLPTAILGLGLLLLLPLASTARAAVDDAPGADAPSNGTSEPQGPVVAKILFHGVSALDPGLKARTLELIATATPGIPDLVLLGRLRQLADQHSDRLVVVDGPAAGHAIALLSTPADIIDAVRSGRLRDQAESSHAFLSDHDRVSVNLVTLPQTTPVNETIETAFAIEERLGVRLGPLVVNMVERPLPQGAGRSLSQRFLAERITSEDAEMQRLRSQLPLPTVIASRLDSAPAAAADLADLVAELGAA